MTYVVFHDYPGLEFGLPKSHDFPGPVVTLTLSKYHSNLTTLLARQISMTFNNNVSQKLIQRVSAQWDDNCYHV